MHYSFIAHIHSARCFKKLIGVARCLKYTKINEYQTSDRGIFPNTGQDEKMMQEENAIYKPSDLSEHH